MHRREREVWKKLNSVRSSVEYWSKYYGIQAPAVYSILYVELQQYSLFNACNVLRRIRQHLTNQSFLHAPGNLALSLNLSLGFSHIKPHTVRRANRFVTVFFGEPRDLYLWHTPTAIRYTCGILGAFIEQWRPVVDISDDLPVLATLYNVSDFGNKPPHPNPKSGGFVGPLYIDGKLLEAVPFGERCLAVATSTNFLKFLRRELP